MMVQVWKPMLQPYADWVWQYIYLRDQKTS